MFKHAMGKQSAGRINVIETQVCLLPPMSDRWQPLQLSFVAESVACAYGLCVLNDGGYDVFNGCSTMKMKMKLKLMLMLKPK